MPQDSPKTLPSFLKGKCPRCRKGDVFTYPLVSFHRFSVTNTHCSNCNLKYEPEPGFYWGAMYISFAFSTGLLIVAAFFLVFYEWSLTKIFTIFPLVLLIAVPFMYRYSRLIMLYFISPKTHRFDNKY